MFIGDYLMHLARVTYSKDNRGGLSVGMNTEFLRPAVCGDVLMIDLQVLRDWENLSIGRMEIREKSSGELVATATLSMMSIPVHFDIKNKL